MSKWTHKQISEAVSLLEEAERKAQTKPQNMADLLVNMQDLALALGTHIEKLRGMGTQTVSALEEFCEALFQVSTAQTEEILTSSLDLLKTSLSQVRAEAEAEFPDKLEVVFLPYKAQMWDSLESIWEAAEADSNCEAYVIPIPYYDRDDDGSLKKEYYEGNQLPANVPVTNYKDYDIELHHPDAILFHNPYDGNNRVTTVHPDYYSKILRQNTDCLVYVPYFASSGGMGEAWGYAECFAIVDYIVVQSESYIGYYDPKIPREKFLPYGSPKFDSIIHKCANPPEVPAEWHEKMDGKKVYFYNTSLNGMLANTESFLRKMEYVFKTFRSHPEACLLWRPHPLLDSTFDSMRPEYKASFEELKKDFLEEGLGIYDDTPDMESTIANCHAYIGDGGTSVISIFGVCGKPIFIFDNYVHSLPTNQDISWLAGVTAPTQECGEWQGKYTVTFGNKLFCREEESGKYHFFCNLSEYNGGGYYLPIPFVRGNNIYVFPMNGQEILSVDEKTKKITRYELKDQVSQYGAFQWAWVYDDKAYLLPNRYPSLVIFDLQTKDVTYVSSVADFNVALTPSMERVPCAKWGNWHGKICMLNQAGTKRFEMDMKTQKIEVKQAKVGFTAAQALRENPQSDEIWFLPFDGTQVTLWNAKTDTYRQYELAVPGLYGFDRINQGRNLHYLFQSAAFEGDYVYFAPYWGNKYVRLNRVTGEATEWRTPFDTEIGDLSDYIRKPLVGGFAKLDPEKPDEYSIFDGQNRKWFAVDLKTGQIGKETLSYEFDPEELRSLAGGFVKESKWLRYSCLEGALNSLEDLITGQIHGNAFDATEQIREFSEVNASPDGSCGEKVYKKIKEDFLNAKR